jgi:hypothetical protein
MNQYMQFTRRIANLASGELSAAEAPVAATTPEDARAKAIEILRKHGVIK